MVLGSGRRVGGWTMAMGAALVLVSVVLLDLAAQAIQSQAAQLDPSSSRLELTQDRAAAAAALGLLGLAVFLVGSITFLIGTARLRRRSQAIERAPGLAAGVASILVLALVLFAFLAPQGPLQLTLATATGGSAEAVEVKQFEGNLTGATVRGVPSAENIHDISLVAPRGAIRLHMGSGGSANAYAVAILEAPQGDGSWREIARTPAQKEAIVDVPVATYSGNLRARVQVAEASAGQVQYILAFSFTPAPRA